MLQIISQHQKEQTIGPLIQQELGLDWVNFSYDTDQFGTFTNEYKRPKTPLNTLRLKLLTGIQLNPKKYRYNLASEGSFYPHPSFFGVHINTELVMLYDATTKKEYLGQSSTGKVIFEQKKVKSMKEILNFCTRNMFPSHGIIIEIPKILGKNVFIKDVQTIDQIEQELTKYKTIILHTDLRSHQNPTRQANIKLATLNLIENLKVENLDFNT